MSWLCDTTELVPAGWLSSRYAGHGVQAENIPSTGIDGPSALYGAVTLPADNGKEIRGYITRWPAAPLDIDEDGAFTYSGGSDYFEFALYADGVADTTNVGFGPGISRITLSIVTVYRPGSDVTVNGWTSTPGGTLASCIDDPTLNRSDFITSPNLTDPATLAWASPLPAGVYEMTIDSDRTGSSGQVRIVCLDAGGTSVGATAWQALTGTATTYTLSVTTSATAPNFRIEVQA
jgi:hypothetical protein